MVSIMIIDYVIYSSYVRTVTVKLIHFVGKIKNVELVAPGGFEPPLLESKSSVFNHYTKGHF